MFFCHFNIHSSAQHDEHYLYLFISKEVEELIMHADLNHIPKICLSVIQTQSIEFDKKLMQHNKEVKVKLLIKFLSLYFRSVQF